MSSSGISQKQPSLLLSPNINLKFSVASSPQMALVSLLQQLMELSRFGTLDWENLFSITMLMTDPSTELLSILSATIWLQSLTTTKSKYGNSSKAD